MYELASHSGLMDKELVLHSRAIQILPTYTADIQFLISTFPYIANIDGTGASQTWICTSIIVQRHPVGIRTPEIQILDWMSAGLPV